MILTNLKIDLKKVKLNQKEISFIYTWLEEDLDIELKNPTLGKEAKNLLEKIVKKFRKEIERTAG